MMMIGVEFQDFKMVKLGCLLRISVRAALITLSEKRGIYLEAHCKD
jgi:hypothetical protein